MSASYEQRKAVVVGVLLKLKVSNVNLIDVADAVLDALDHVPEKLDWVSQVPTRNLR